MPASAVVALARVGFCRDEVKPFGPVHAYVAPATVGVESEIVAPAQYGPPFDAVGVAGIGLTVIAAVRALLVAQAFVAVTLSVPLVAVFEKLTVTELVVPVIVAPLPV
jgi:hypothetical protein